MTKSVGNPVILKNVFTWTDLYGSLSVSSIHVLYKSGGISATQLIDGRQIKQIVWFEVQYI